MGDRMQEEFERWSGERLSGYSSTITQAAWLGWKNAWEVRAALDCTPPFEGPVIGLGHIRDTGEPTGRERVSPHLPEPMPDCPPAVWHHHVTLWERIRDMFGVRRG